MWLRFLVPIALISILVSSCTPSRHISKSVKPQKIELIPDDQDSTEYDLIIIEPGFQPWFDMNRKPEWYYSKDYLANWNYQYVVAWNARFRDLYSTQNLTDNPFILEIDYRPNVDYGLDLNYKLYHYFKYVEATWGKILPYERHN